MTALLSVIARHWVRDVGVAGSNLATPTIETSVSAHWPVVSVKSTASQMSIEEIYDDAVHLF